MSIDKYDTEHRWFEPCVVCGKPVEMTAARHEVLGTYHDGCFGYPACSCPKSHEGDCTEATMNAKIVPLPPPVPAKDLGADAQVLPFQMKDGSTLWTGGSSGPLTLEMIQKAHDAMVNYVPPTTEEFLRAVSPHLYELYLELLRGSPYRYYLRPVSNEEE